MTYRSILVILMILAMPLLVVTMVVITSEPW